MRNLLQSLQTAPKPENMTHLDRDTLVSKCHPRIIFRGKLDSLQSMIVLVQMLLQEEHKEFLIQDLDQILHLLMEVMRCDVTGEPVPEYKLLGLTSAELRDHSHHPEKYYQIRQMIMPEYHMGKAYVYINRLRTQVRETEVAAVKAFGVHAENQRKDILEVLNRCSSAMHILMCRILANETGEIYGKHRKSCYGCHAAGEIYTD